MTAVTTTGWDSKNNHFLWEFYRQEVDWVPTRALEGFSGYLLAIFTHGRENMDEHPAAFLIRALIPSREPPSFDLVTHKAQNATTWGNDFNI